LPVATTLAGVNMRLKAGAYRELHWHKEAEWAFMLAGSARIAAIDPQGRNFIEDIGRGDLWNLQAGFPHPNSPTASNYTKVMFPAASATHGHMTLAHPAVWASALDSFMQHLPHEA
jgi:hypothetical protein